MNRLSRPLILSALAGLTALTALVAACGGGGGGYGGGTPTSPQPNPATITVEVRDYEFYPKSIKVAAGDTVTWRLVGSDHTHSVTAIGGVFDSGFIFTSAGSSFSRTFTVDDLGKTFEYWCATHHATKGMQGSVRVGDSSPPPSPGY